MSVRIRNASRLIHAHLLVMYGMEFWELPEYPDIDPREDDLIHQVDATDRMDRIAAKYYRDPGLWWVIALANGKRNFPYDLEVGELLRIPTPTFVLSKLLKPR